MRTFLYAPAIDGIEDLHDQIVRIGWYFFHLQDCRFLIKTNLSRNDVVAADYIDPLAYVRVQEWIDSGKIVLQEEVAESTAVDGAIAWQGVAPAKAFLSECGVSYVDGFEIYNVDKSHRMEASLYIDVANAILAEKPRTTPYAQRFGDLAKTCRSANSYLFCTGPSLQGYADFDFSDGISIICNSVIFDEELLSVVEPRILVFADPIFHFGCSTYAEQFRARLRDVAIRYDLKIVIPDKYINAFIASLPELSERAIAVPYESEIGPNFELDASFRTKATDNILTFLMLPLAASLSENVFLLGCDGRKIEDDEYFWAHSAKAQINTEMTNIQKAHPSFFNLDYNEYYLRHCDTLEDYAQRLESLGKRVIGLTPSYIDALQTRRFPYDRNSDSGPIIVSVNPDLTNDFGHFYHYDVRLAEQLPTGTSFVVWANKAVDVQDSSLTLTPTFADNTFRIRGTERVSVASRFRKSLIARLHELRLLRTRKVLYMYTCDQRHARIFADVAEEFPNLFSDITVHLNLFFMHYDVDVARRAIIRPLAYQALAIKVRKASGILLYADSARLRKLANTSIGPGMRDWPMIHVSSLDALEQAAALPLSRSQERIRVLCPGTGQLIKGYDTACKVISAILEGPYSERFEFVVRDLLRDRDEANSDLLKLHQQIAVADNVEVLNGVLAEEEYLAEFAKADVFLLPYRKKDFFTRTSAALIDALFFRKPVVCVSDTWLEEEASEFGLAISFSAGDVEQCTACLYAMIEGGKTEAKLDRQDWTEKYTPRNLCNTIDPGGSLIIKSSNQIDASH